MPMKTLGSEWPFAYAVADDRVTDTCHYCLKIKQTDISLLRCSGCKFARFCNKKCHENAWPDHKDECKRLALGLVDIGLTARLLSRVIMKCLKNDIEIRWEMTSEKRVWGPEGRRFSDLLSHCESILLEEAEVIALLWQQIGAFLGEKFFRRLSLEDLAEIYGKYAINAIDIYQFGTTKVGEGIYLNISALDHSCKPSAVYVYDGPKIIIQGRESAKTLKEATLPYLPPFLFVEQRKSLLKKKYYFDCNCAECRDEDSNRTSRAFLCPNMSCNGPVVLSGTNTRNLEYTCTTCKAEYDNDAFSNAVAIMERLKGPMLSDGEAETLDSLRNLVKEASELLFPFNFAMCHLYKRLLCLSKTPEDLSCWGEKVLDCYEYHHIIDPDAISLNLSTAEHFMKIGKSERGSRLIAKAEELAKNLFPEDHDIFRYIAAKSDKILVNVQ